MEFELWYTHLFNFFCKEAKKKRKKIKIKKKKKFTEKNVLIESFFLSIYDKHICHVYDFCKKNNNYQSQIFIQILLCMSEEYCLVLF
jgi:hypothetical protein